MVFIFLLLRPYMLTHLIAFAFNLIQIMSLVFITEYFQFHLYFLNYLYHEYSHPHNQLLINHCYYLDINYLVLNAVFATFQIHFRC